MKRALSFRRSGFRMKYVVCRLGAWRSLFDIGKYQVSQGFTIIELTIGMAIFIMLLLAITGMMMTAFRTDNQTKAFEEVQIANLAIVNDLIQTARFSTWATITGSSPFNTLTIFNDNGTIVTSDDQTTEYKVDMASMVLMKSINGTSEGSLISSKLKVEKFEVINKAPAPGQVELLLVKIKLVDTLGEMKDAKDKQIMLSIRK